MVIFDPGASGLEFKWDGLKCKSMTEFPPTKRLDNLSINPLKVFKWTSKAWRFPNIKWILFHSSFWLATSVKQCFWESSKLRFLWHFHKRLRISRYSESPYHNFQGIQVFPLILAWNRILPCGQKGPFKWWVSGYLVILEWIFSCTVKFQNVGYNYILQNI